MRISQSWQKPPADAPPPAVVPADCDREALAALCPADPEDPQTCLTCLRNQTDVCSLKCCGTDVWAAWCNGPAAQGVDIQVFSDLPSITLWLNGESQGTAACTPGGFAAFSLPKWVPGNLTATGAMAAGGEVLAQHTLVTAGAPAAVELAIDVPSAMTGTGESLLLDGHDSGLVRATIVDAEGLIVDSDLRVTFSIESGPGKISGVHNGDAKSHEPQDATARHAYHGLCRAAVKVTHDATSASILAEEVEVQTDESTVTLGDYDGAAEIVVVASAPGLKPGRAVIQVSADASLHSVLAAAEASVGSGLRFD